MRMTQLLFVLLFGLCANAAIAADATMNKDLNYSLNTGSFIYHAYSPGQTYTQYFQNQFIAVEKKIDNPIIDSIIAGTLLNSYGNRCALLGVQKNWSNLSDRMTFEGVYSYAGEFFFDAFSECGEMGIYHDIKKATGLGFAPYIYHGIEYDLHPNVSLEAGVILPGIIVFSLQWHL